MGSFFDQFEKQAPAQAPNAPAPPAAPPQGGGGKFFSDHPQPTPIPNAPAPLSNAPTTEASYLPQAHTVPSILQQSDPYLLNHLASWGQGIKQLGGAANDYVRVATNPFGVGDRFAAAMPGGGDLEQQRAATAEAEQRLGLPGTLAANMTGYAPVAAIGIAPKIAESLGAASGGIKGWLAGVGGSAAEGAGAGAAGAAGHGENPITGAGIGGALGAVGGTFGVGGNRTIPPTVNAKDLAAQASKAYEPLNHTIFMQNEVKPRLDAIDAFIGGQGGGDWTGKQRELAKSTMAEYKNLAASPQLTGTDIQKAQARLNKIGNSPTATDQDKRFAPMFAAGLQDIMDNGIAVNAPTGFAGQVKAAGDVLHGQASDVARLDRMQAATDVANGPDVGTQAKSYLLSQAKQPGGGYTPPGSPIYNAMNTLAATGEKPFTNREGLTQWDIIRHLIWPTMGAGVGSVWPDTWSGGQDRTTREIAGGLAGLGGELAFKGAANAAARAYQQRALAAARATAGTGTIFQPARMGAPTAAPMSDALRAIIFGQAAGGNLPGM